MYLASGKRKHDRTFWLERRGGDFGAKFGGRCSGVRIATSFSTRVSAALNLCCDAGLSRFGCASCGAELGQEKERQSTKVWQAARDDRHPGHS